MSFDKITNPLKLEHLVGDMECDYIYTTGIAGEKFFIALRDEEKFLVTRCEKCDITYLPPRMYCEICFESLEEYVEVPTSGTVDTFTLTHEDMAAKRLDKPVVVAFIRIDKTNGGLIHQLGEVDAGDVKIGMRVVPVFEEKSKRSGGLKDIKYFKPE